MARPWVGTSRRAGGVGAELEDADHKLFRHRDGR